jgi:hypothetical protein
MDVKLSSTHLRTGLFTESKHEVVKIPVLSLLTRLGQGSEPRLINVNILSVLLFIIVLAYAIYPAFNLKGTGASQLLPPLNILKVIYRPCMKLDPCLDPSRLED